MERLPRNNGVCRFFLRGHCRFGDRCRFRHERPSPQICRHFQKGGCWFGDHCKYLHVYPSEGIAALPDRTGSVLNVSSSSSIAASSLSDRRRSQPTVLQAEVTLQQQQCCVHNASSNQQMDTQHVAAETAEGHSQETNVMATAQNAEDGGNLQENTEVIEGATAAVSSPSQPVSIAQAILHSKEQICGICMDKIYEKPELGDRKFGILPNCNHSFCLKCIVTWRKTRDLGPDVVKTCPQCRVKSAFYVPHEYWVEGPEKESLITAFKKKYSKKTCSYFLRHGCCPFKSDCLYRHGKTLHHRIQIPDDVEDYWPSDVLNFLLAMTFLDDSDEDDDDDDEEFNIFDMPLYLVREHSH